MRTKLFFILALSLFSLNIFAQTPKTISGGLVNDRAKELPKPAYPQAARAVRASGMVNVQVTIDENGEVISASAVSGHPLLRGASEAAARLAKFSPTMLSGQPVKVTGIITYNFAPLINWIYTGIVLGDAEIEIEDADKLKSVADDLTNEFADEGKSLKTIAANFEKNGEFYRNQTAQISQIINSLQSKISGQAETSWDFEFGLTRGRVGAGYFDDAVLRDNLPKFKALYESAPEWLQEDTLDALRELGKMAGKDSYSRKDKKKIRELVEDL